MVDRNARNTLAQNLRWLVTGQITNDDFDDVEPVESLDRAVNQIWQTGSCMYSDTHQYRLKGRYKVSSEVRKTVARAVLFLRSDCEYEWPDMPSSCLQTYLVATAYAGWIGSLGLWLIGNPNGPVVMSASTILLLFAQLALFMPSRKTREWRNFEKAGEYEFWPFLRKVDFDRANQSRHLLGKPTR